MEYLLQAAAVAVLDLISFADEKVESGVMARKRLDSPRMEEVAKMGSECNSTLTESPTTENGSDNTGGAVDTIFLGRRVPKAKGSGTSASGQHLGENWRPAAGSPSVSGCP